MDVRVGICLIARPLIKLLSSLRNRVDRRVDLEDHLLPLFPQKNQRPAATAFAPHRFCDAQVLDIAEAVRFPVEQQPGKIFPLIQQGEVVLLLRHDGELHLRVPLLKQRETALIKRHRFPIARVLSAANSFKPHPLSSLFLSKMYPQYSTNGTFVPEKNGASLCKK